MAARLRHLRHLQEHDIRLILDQLTIHYVLLFQGHGYLNNFLSWKAFQALAQFLFHQETIVDYCYPQNSARS